jgi:hypothetical protein
MPAMNLLSCSSARLGLVVAACAVLAACSDDETTPPADGTSSSSTSSSSGGSSTSSSSSGSTSSSGGAAASNNDVDITVTGEFSATLKGKAGTCGGVEGGASFVVKSEELGVSPTFEIAVIILSEEDWPTPPTILNVKEPNKASYAWNKTAGTVVAQRDRSKVELDADLKNVATGGIVHVKGSIVCN